MNQRDDLDRLLSGWVEDPFTPPAPRYLGEVLERTRRTPQRPAWASLERWLPMVITLRNPVLPMPARLLAIGLIGLMALLATLAAVPFLSGASPFPAAITGGQGGLIAFSRAGDIYVVEPGPAAAPRAIVAGPEEDLGPLWSPDGRHLLFLRIGEDGEVPMLTDAQGTSPTALVREALVGVDWVNWAPDSSALVVGSEVERLDDPGTLSPTLSIVPTDGSGDVQHLRNRPGPETDLPDWRSGSGSTPALLYRQRSDPGELWYVESTERRGMMGQVLGVEDMAGVRTGGYGGTYDFLNPAWSPDGDRFVYHTLNEVESAPDGNGFRVHVARFERDHPTGPMGREDTLIEFDPAADDEGWPVWSPDGSRIAFQTYDQGRARLVIVPIAGNGAPEATGPAVSTEPFFTVGPGRLGYSWAPDGSSLVLVKLNLSPDPNAYLVDPATGELTPLTWRSDEGPSWRPVSP
ncbi:hypothetical protein BH23CHL8_BH23CHL8_24030 [soil metagenome]